MASYHLIGPLKVPGLPERRVRVKLPPSEPRREGARPVLYLFDGQNIFDDYPSFAGGWHVHDTIDQLAAGGRRGLPLVVGIDNGGDKRIAELSPWGRADELLRWVIESVAPMVARDFGGGTGPHHSVIGGSSMGGLAALYAHFRYPEFFGGALCMSPSFWYGSRKIFDFVASQSNPWTSRVYIDCGVREGRGTMFALARRMADHLASRGYGEDKLMWRPDARGAHNEASWRRRMPKALRFMFPSQPGAVVRRSLPPRAAFLEERESVVP